jgi:hypothetical protein
MIKESTSPVLIGTKKRQSIRTMADIGSTARIDSVIFSLIRFLLSKITPEGFNYFTSVAKIG